MSKLGSKGWDQFPHRKRRGPRRGSLWHDSKFDDKRGRSFGRILKRLAAAPFVLVAALVILLEDWLWDDLARLGAALGRLPILRQIEALIVALPPYAALLFFAAPSLLLVPLKLAALYLISKGQTALGVLTIIFAKVAGTALVARIYVLTRPKLLRIVWFALLHERFLTFKARIYEVVRSTAIYRAAHEVRLLIHKLIKHIKGHRRRSWRRRWSRIRQLARRRRPQPKYF